MDIDREKAKQVVEALLFASTTPLRLKTFQRALGEEFQLGAKELRSILDELKEDYTVSLRAFELLEVAQGYKIQSKSKFHPYIQKIIPLKRVKLSVSTLEVLAVVAYKQPITKAEIEEIRGVDCSYQLSQLLERSLTTNHKKLDAPGQPSLYETTEQFLEYFGLKNVKDLPKIEEAILINPS